MRLGASTLQVRKQSDECLGTSYDDASTTCHVRTGWCMFVDVTRLHGDALSARQRYQIDVQASKH